MRLARNLGTAAILVALLALVASASSGQGFALDGLTGGSLSDAELAHGNTVVVLWASWSPRGRDVAERVNALAKHTAGRARVLAVNYQEDAATVRRFVAASPFDVSVYLDTDGVFAKRYKIATLPGLLVLKNGEVAFQGRMPEDADRLVSDALQ